MIYWFDAYTGTTWSEFRSSGAEVTGFRKSYWNLTGRVGVGDIFLCYLVGVKRWVGVLEVVGERFLDDSPIFGEELFPVRLPVKPLLMLDPEFGVPMKDLTGRLSFLKRPNANWSSWVRNALKQYNEVDGKTIAEALEAAKKAPVAKPVDARMLKRPANLFKVNDLLLKS